MIYSSYYQSKTHYQVQIVSSNPISRRHASKWLLSAIAACCLGLTPSAHATYFNWRRVLTRHDRWLSLERDSTGENANFRYHIKGNGLDPRGYAIACHLLRDVASNVTVSISPRLLDLLYLIQVWLRLNKLPYRIVIMSGYRTPAYNATIKGAAKNSEHTKGTAADIRIPGLQTKYLADLAKALSGGGVGFYERKGFVHVDVGRVRSWVD